jgi:hypothetical protein
MGQQKCCSANALFRAVIQVRRNATLIEKTRGNSRKREKGNGLAARKEAQSDRLSCLFAAFTRQDNQSESAGPAINSQLPGTTASRP